MNQDFTDLLRALCAADARFLIVGAYAVTWHAVPRSTGDLDVWIEPTPDNAERVWSALTAFGAPLDQLSVEDLRAPDVVFQLGVPPRRIDLLTSVTAVDFARAWERRVTAAFGDLEVPTIGLQDLITNKRAVGRPRDLADVALLESHAAGP